MVEVALNLPSSSISIPVILALIFLIIQIVILQHELIEIKSQRPNIVVDGFRLERPFYLIRDGQSREKLERYYIITIFAL